MSSFLIYILKASVSLSVVYLFYQLLLRRLTFYNWNRWYLILYTLLCFAVPFIDVSVLLEENNLRDNDIITWVPVIGSSQPAPDTGFTGASLPVSFWIGVILIIGAIVMLIRLLVQYISFRQMRKKAVYLSGGEIRLYQVNESIVPFSFGRAVFINKNLHTEAELQDIIRHEFVHVRQRHSLDIIWSELLCIANWFNPFAWLLKKAIRQNLEFIADNKVLQNGINKKAYQYLLLKVTGNNQYSIATPFNFSSLKKRIAMMNKLKSARVHLVKFLFLLPLAAVLLLAFRSERKKNELPAKNQQNIYLAGLIVDAATKQPLSGAEIFVKERNLRINTDEKGYYLLELPYENKPLSFSMLVSKPGYGSFYQQENWGNFYDDYVREKYTYTFEFFGLEKKGRKNSGFSSLAGNAKEIEGLNYTEALKRFRKLSQGYLPDFISDTIPHSSSLNSKGYQITVKDNKGNCLLVIKDAKGKEVKRLLLDDWNKDEAKYEALYGKIPPPPPPPPPGDPVAPEAETAPISLAAPLSPAAPSVKDLPKNVTSVQVNNNKVTVKLKNGQVETYDKNNAGEMKLFESRYGDILPETPAPPPPPAKTGIVEEVRATSASNKPFVTIGGKELPDNILYVLDGDITDKSAVSRLDPSAIKSIDILKGSAAEAIYGDKGKGGVIKIKTKATEITAPVTHKPSNKINDAVAPAVAVTEKPAARSIYEEETADILNIGGLSMKDEKQYILVDGKEFNPRNGEKLKGTFRITFLDKKEAEKKFGAKGKNGAIIAETIK